MKKKEGNMTATNTNTGQTNEKHRLHCEAKYWVNWVWENGHASWQAQKFKMIKRRGKDSVDMLVNEMNRLRDE